ncbi:MAG: hypothetical protein WCK34_08625, partial [Bacteroidota bacterium]
IIQGSDYVTFNGIDVAASSSGIEYGYYLRKAGPADGCKNVAITNCAITMTKGTSKCIAGIFASNNDAQSAINLNTGITLTSTGGRNENVTLTGNTITNVFSGIVLIGYNQAASPYDFYDQNFVVGSAGAGNVIRNFAGNTASAAYGIYLIRNTSPTISYNTIDNAGGGGSNATLDITGIYIDGTVAGGDLIANNNTIILGQGSSSAATAINNMPACSSGNFNNNTFGYGTFTSSVLTMLIYSERKVNNITVTGNQTTGTINKTGIGKFYGCYFKDSPTSGTAIISNNNFSNITVTGASEFMGIQVSFTNVLVNINNNIISNITGGTSFIIGIYLGSCLAGSTVSGNTISNITNLNYIWGLCLGYVGSPGSFDASNNTIHGLTSTTTSFLAGILIAGGDVANIHHNNIYNLSNLNASGQVIGIHANGGNVNNLYNNLISDLTIPSGADNAKVYGIKVYGGNSGNRIYSNTVYLAGTSSGNNFGSAALWHYTGYQVDLRNNIFVNMMVPTGTGIAAAYQMSGSALAGYSWSSNNNLYYAGSPSASNLIFYDGTYKIQTIAGLQSLLSGKENASVSELPPFVNVAATPYDLHLQTGVPTFCESGATVVSTPVSVTTGYDNTARYPNTGYPDDAVTPASAPDIGAFEFDGRSILAADNVTGGGIFCSQASASLGLDNSLSGATYQLYQNSSSYGSVKNGTGSALTWSSMPTGTYTVKAILGPRLRWMTGSATVTINAALTSGTASGTQTICYNTTPSGLSCTDATGGSSPYTYQWQSGSSGWQDIGGATSLSYAPGALTATTQFRLATTDAGTPSCGTVYSNTLTVTVRSNFTPGTIGSTNAYVCYGGNPAVISSSANATGGDGTISYQWLSSTDAGFTSPVTISANTSAYLPPSGLTATTWYRREAKDGTCNTSWTTSAGTKNVILYSNFDAGSIRVAGESICYNGNPSSIGSSADATGGDGAIAYQWQSSANAGFSSPADIANNLATYDPPAGLTTTTWYRRLATDGSCNPSWSASGGSWKVTIRDAFDAGAILTTGETISSFGDHSVIGSSAAAAGGNGTYTYKWQSSSDDLFTSPTDIANDALAYDPPAGLTSTTWYRRLAKDGACNTGWNVSTGTWQVTVSTIFTPGSILATGESLCFNSNPGIIGSVVPATGGSGTISYQWQSSCNAGFTSPADIANNAPTYDPPSALTATTWYRRQAKDGTPGADWTSSAGTWQVTVTPQFVPGSAGSNQVICYNGTPAQVSCTPPSGGTAPYACQWQGSSDNVTFTDIAGSTATGYQPGSLTQTTYYRQKQTSSAGCGQVFTPEVTITVHPNSITASSTANPVCAGSSTTIYAAAGSDFTWDQGLGDGSTKTVSPATATTYTVTGTDAYGCTGETASVTVAVSPLPVLHMTGSSPDSANGASYIPLGASEILSVTGAAAYHWSSGSTSGTVTVTPATTTTYPVTGTTAGCSATASRTVNIASANAGPNKFVCFGSSTTLTASATGFTPTGYLWAPGGQTTQAITVSPLATTLYSLTVTGVTGVLAHVTVFVNPKPTANAGPDILIAPSGSGILNGCSSAGTPPYLYCWSTTGGSVVSGNSTATPVVNVAGNYTMLVTDAFGCSSSDDAYVTLSSAGFPVSGNVAYAFNLMNPQMHDVTVRLKQGAVVRYTTTTSSSGNGNYLFPSVDPGSYTICLSSSKPWGGVTTTDIAMIQNHYKTPGGTPLVGIKRLAADVVANSSAAIVNAVDRDTISAKRVAPTFPFSTGNWLFTKIGDISLNTYPIAYANSAGYSDITLTVSAAPVVQDFRSLCYGDVDASYTGLKDSENPVADFTASDGLGLINIPNPFTRQTTIRFTVPATASVTVFVYSLMGMPVATISDPDDYEGVHNLVFDAEGLAPGLYLYTVKLKTSDDLLIQTGKMMLMH